MKSKSLRKPLLTSPSSLLFQPNTLWSVLSYFLSNPSTRIHVNELARVANVSAGSASNALVKLTDMKLLKVQHIGQLHLYSLENDSLLVRNLLRTHFISTILELDVPGRFLEHDEALISLVLYGSYASGDQDEKSDVDLLVITSSKLGFRSVLDKLETELNCEVNLTVFSLTLWAKTKDTAAPFYQSVMRNHVLLYGEELI